MKKRALRRRYGRSRPSSLGGPRSVEEYVLDAADYREMAAYALKKAELSEMLARKPTQHSRALRKLAARHHASAGRMDHEVMRLGGAP